MSLLANQIIFTDWTRGCLLSDCAKQFIEVVSWDLFYKKHYWTTGETIPAGILIDLTFYRNQIGTRSKSKYSLRPIWTFITQQSASKWSLDNEQVFMEIRQWVSDQQKRISWFTGGRLWKKVNQDLNFEYMSGDGHSSFYIVMKCGHELWLINCHMKIRSTWYYRSLLLSITDLLSLVPIRASDEHQVQLIIFNKDAFLQSLFHVKIDKKQWTNLQLNHVKVAITVNHIDRTTQNH